MTRFTLAFAALVAFAAAPGAAPAPVPKPPKPFVQQWVEPAPDYSYYEYHTPDPTWPEAGNLEWLPSEMSCEQMREYYEGLQTYHEIQASLTLYRRSTHNQLAWKYSRLAQAWQYARQARSDSEAYSYDPVYREYWVRNHLEELRNVIGVANFFGGRIHLPGD